MRKVYFIEKFMHDHEKFVHGHEKFVYGHEKIDEASMKRRWNFDDDFFVAMCKWDLIMQSHHNCKKKILYVNGSNPTRQINIKRP